MSKHKLTDVEIYRLWDMHKLGIPKTKIAAELLVSERTVRYHLAKPEPENGGSSSTSLNISEQKRKDTVVDILDRLIVELSNQLRGAKDIKITRPSEFLKVTEALTNAIEMHNRMSSNENARARTQNETIDFDELDSWKEVSEDVRRSIIKESKSKN